MLTAPSQVLIRNIEIFQQGRWLLINPSDSEIFSALGDADVWGFHQFYDQYASVSNSEKHTFSHHYQDQTPFNGVVIYMPKAKAHLSMLLAQASALMPNGGNLLVVGENKSGAKSAGKLMSTVAEHVHKLDTARHCSLFSAQVTNPVASFDITQWYKHITFTIGQRSLTVCSLPGVFSHGELDPATELLLTNMPIDGADTLLDFACGAGVIGVWLAKHGTVSKLTMADVSALALHCAEQTARSNGVEATIIPCNGLQGITGKFDTVVTNPPFHTGVKTDHSIAADFIQQLRQHLTKQYCLLLVANRFLPYPEQLAKSLKQPKTLAQTNKFSLYYCHASQ